MYIPNWTTNRIICKKELGDKILAKTDDSYSFDFNTLIKMPKDLEIESGSNGEDGLMYLYLKSKNKKEKDLINSAYKNCNEFFNNINNESRYKRIKSNLKAFENKDNFQEIINLGKKYLSNYKKYGYCNWYKWCINNWGTKWNVENDCNVDYNPETKEYTITFDTAWSCPIHILEKYSELCEDGELNWMYYDEDYDGHIFVTKDDGQLTFRKEYYDMDFDENISI